MSTDGNITPDPGMLNAEIQANYAAFQELLPNLLPDSKGKFCIMKSGKLIETFDTVGDAFKTARRLYPDGIFSIQEVTNIPVELGYFSHAVSCH